ncbi:MAG TPA: polysaccharide deacetylase family protein [Myxococcales bacterium]|nr:polysaccharide deacetylase family protein [Myxococcales bacterium]
MILALLLALASAADRNIIIDGKPFSIPGAAEAGAVKLPVNVLLSADERALLATLLHRAWTPDDPQSEKAHPETPVLLRGRAPDFDFEHAGARIDERLRLLLWRRPEKVRGLSFFVGVAVKQPGIRPLLPPTLPPEASHDALDRALADFSFGLSQSRHVGDAPRVVWVELAEAPPGAEDLLLDLPASQEPPLQSATPRAPLVLQPLPPITAVSPEVISRPESAVKRVALTFDACSTLDRSFYDDRVTRVLVQTKTPATLFISGRWAETHLRLMRVLSENPLFEIANHSYIHPHMTEMPPERQREELLWTQQILLSLTGKLPRFFRPPYGEYDAEVTQIAAANGLRTVEYDFPSGDPDKHIGKERLIAWVLAKARPGSIVVMHMNRHGWHTAEALPDIIAGLRQRGFVLSQVGEMVQ